MPEKSQKRKLRSDQSTSQFDIETASSINDENAVLSERDFEDISNKIENKISKRLRDTELNQREILNLIESLSSKVDNLSSVNSEQGYLTTRTENSGNPTEELEEVGLSRNESSNTDQYLAIGSSTACSVQALSACRCTAMKLKNKCNQTKWSNSRVSMSD